MRVNNLLSHFGQPKPPDMSEKLFKSGEKGCVTSNLVKNYGSIYKGMMNWMNDLDGGLGHRRWSLDPYIEKTGFGRVNPYQSMYAIEGANKEARYKNVAWTCTKMPLEFSGKNQWSLSTGKILGDNSDNEVKVTNKQMENFFFSEKKNTLNIDDVKYDLYG